MRDKKKEPLRLEGKTVILEEIAPKYFPYVVEWRNNPELNKYLNQPFVLTEEKERDWYENIYLNDDTQGLMILIDRETGTPFGTSGWTHMDLAKKQCIAGRSLIGNLEFRSSLPSVECGVILSDYLYSFVDTMYCHVVTENRKVIALNKHGGYAISTADIKYPEECLVNEMTLTELFRTKEMYKRANKKWASYFPEIFNDR